MFLLVYFRIYVLLVLFYLWYRFIFRFIHDVKQEKEYPIYHKKASIIVPVYNEKDYILEMCVNSLLRADGENEIILVDDCSTNNSWEKIKELKRKHPQIIAIHLKRNMGKRHAQYYGLQYSSGHIIVTVDSKSVIDSNAITELLKPFNDSRVGATTGQIRVLNRGINLLTKMIESRYLSASGLERASLSSFGIVTCCSGALSAYRKEIFEQIKEIYINQMFLGQKCTYGDDRNLTNLVLQRGFQVKFVKKAIVRTEVPYTYKNFFKQQLRWKKSFLRESLITFRFAFKKNKLLALETSLNFVIHFVSLVSRLVMIYLAIVFPIMIIPIIFSLVVIVLLRNILAIIEEGPYALYSVPYVFVHELGLYWLYWVALFSLKDTKWGTR